MLTRVSFAPQAVAEHIREQLRQNRDDGRMLGRLLAGLPLDRGATWAFVPEGAEAKAHDFDAGIFSPEDTAELAALLAERILPRLATPRPDGSRGVLVFEYWTDVDGHQDSPAKSFRVGTSTFDYADAATNRAQVERLLRSALWFPTVGVVGRLPEGAGDEDRKTLPPQTLDTLVETVELLLVGAWDADGYVLWEPPPV